MPRREPGNLRRRPPVRDVGLAHLARWLNVSLAPGSDTSRALGGRERPPSAGCHDRPASGWSTDSGRWALLVACQDSQAQFGRRLLFVASRHSSGRKWCGFSASEFISEPTNRRQAARLAWPAAVLVAPGHVCMLSWANRRNPFGLVQLWWCASRRHAPDEPNALDT